MEYLPEKKRTQQVQIRKKEAKLMDFRQYLADKEVVLAMTKCKFPALNFNPYHLLTYLHFISHAINKMLKIMARRPRQTYA